MPIKFAAEPTDAQREAGNFKKKHIWLHGLDISIETPKGVRRRPQWPPMAGDYGYIKGTLGADGDHVDVLLGPDKDSELVVIVDQVDRHGRFDEHKCLLGFKTRQAAVDTYRKCYTKGWKVGPTTSLTIDQFKAWLNKGDTATRLEKQVNLTWKKSASGLSRAILAAAAKHASFR